MTNKQLIEKIKHIGIEEIRLAIEKIEKDLEVLDILKTKVFDETKCFNLKEGWYDDIFYLNENEVKLIKEVLKDD